MKVGDRVRIIESVIVYHKPKHKKEPFQLQGMSGEVINIIGKPISANLPIVVQFEPKFSAHLKEDEVEVIS